MAFPLWSLRRIQCRSCFPSRQKVNLISVAEKHRRCDLVPFGEQPVKVLEHEEGVCGRIPRREFAIRERYSVIRELVTLAALGFDLVTDLREWWPEYRSGRRRA